MVVSWGKSKLGRLVASALTLAVLACLTSCGGGASDVAPSIQPSASDFPPADGRTIDEILESQNSSELVVAPAATVFEVGKRNRYPFGVFEVDRTPVNDADVALYFAKSPTSAVEGPLPARVDSLATKPAFRAKGSEGPGEVEAFYVVPDVRFDRPGPWIGIAVINGPDGPESTRITQSPAPGQFPNVARVGQKAPGVSTPTAASVGGDLAKIDTRQPPSSMHDVDLTDALGKRPVVLAFATPALCQSRVCGPVVDVVEQVKAETDGDTAFIHQEIFNGNDPNQGLRPQLDAFGLRTEPWLFLIGRDGRIKERIEGAFGVEELRAAVRRLQGE